MSECSCSSHGSFLTAKGLKEAAQRRSLEGLAPLGDHAYVDRVVSVRGVVEVEGGPWLCDEETDNQYRRFLNGS